MKWISVAESLPPSMKSVLIFDLELLSTNMDAVAVGWFDGIFWRTVLFGSGYDNEVVCDVTHWRPIPSLPKLSKEL